MPKKRKSNSKKITAPQPKICPLCQKPKTEFEKHHVVWRMDGGSDDKTNLLEICKTCHLTITNGCIEDSKLLNLTALAHQMQNHGVDFLSKSNALNTAKLPFNKHLAELKRAYPDDYDNLIDQAVKVAGSIVYGFFDRKPNA